jgi:YHS domain-containing protein
MNASKIILTIAAIMLAIGLAGCKKKESPAAPKTTAENVQKQATASIEQTTCPVMEGNKIDKNIFVEYKGKKVHFCCADCKGKFLAEPEKYLAKLPQFAK